MFRASQISSEETLPALSAVTLSDDINRRSSWPNNEYSSLKSRQPFERKFERNYGGLLPPPSSANSNLQKYPTAVGFILATKFFEAFAANGIRTILALYLRDALLFSESFSTIMLHIFNFFGQFCPIFGAILADSYIGNVRTISSFCYLYAFGWILLIITSVPGTGTSIILIVGALLFIAIGNGSIRACVTSLGALQFQVPEQARQLAEYFSLYYFVYYFGIFTSKIVPPLIRADTKCFGKTVCYPAVFGTLAISFAAAWFIFLLGKFFYKSEKISEENILIKCYGCIKYALVQKWTKTDKNVPRPKYWLNNAIGEYDEQFVNDVAKVLRISKLFIPLPIYFALLAQQDSSWTFQATMMNTTIANGALTIEPDQAKAMGPIFLFLLIPLWQYICVPLMRNCLGWEMNALQSVTVGGACSAFSFLCAGILQESIYKHPYKSLKIAWQVPQFFLIMLGELLLSIPGLKFAFTQAPASMKSVVTAAWFLNNAFGNLIVVIVTEINIFNSQSNEYFFYAVMMFVSITMFALLAYDYTQLEPENGQRIAANERLAQSYITMGSNSNSTLNMDDPLVHMGSSNTLHLDADNVPSTSRPATISPERR